MDFSRQLANLQRSAAAATSSGGQQVVRKRGREDEASNDSSYRRHENDGSPASHRDQRWEGGGGGRRSRSWGNRKGDEGKYCNRTDRDRGGGGGALSRLVQSVLANPFSMPSQPKQQQVQVSSDQHGYLHLALLFLTIDDLPFENIWRAWLDGAGCNQNCASGNMIVSVLCHAKFPDRVKSPWLKQRLLIDKLHSSEGRVRYHSRIPNWGSIEITRAMIDLVQEGLAIGPANATTPPSPTGSVPTPSAANPRRFLSTPPSSVAGRDDLPLVDRFIFVSETCLPVTSLDEVETAIFEKAQGTAAKNTVGGDDAGKSWLRARNTPNNGYARQQQWDRVAKVIPTTHIWKADQWILLTRLHAEAMCGTRRKDGGSPSSQLWEGFRRTRASDEIYFPTVMALFGILKAGKECSGNDDEHENSSIGKEVVYRRVTYCDWSMNAKNPASFKIAAGSELKAADRRGGSEFVDVARKAREEGCLLARKFVTRELLSGSSASQAKHFTSEEWMRDIGRCGKSRWFASLDLSPAGE